MRPLDSGVLSLGRARTPARGRWAEPLFFSLIHRGRLLLRLFYERRCANEREGEAKNELGFERAAAVAGFSSDRNARRIVDRRSTASRHPGRIRPRRVDRFLAQAQVAAWARGEAPRASAGMGLWLWAARTAVGSGRNDQTNSTVTVFFNFLIFHKTI